jgi:hypothetical protein
MKLKQNKFWLTTMFENIASQDDIKKAYQMLPMPRDFSSQASVVFAKKTGRQPTQQELLDLWSKQKEAFGK